MADRRSIPAASTFDGSLPPFNKSTTMQTQLAATPAKGTAMELFQPPLSPSPIVSEGGKLTLLHSTIPSKGTLSTSHPRCSVCTAHGRSSLRCHPSPARFWLNTCPRSSGNFHKAPCMASPTPLLLVWWHAPIEYFQPKLGPSQSRQWRVLGQVPQSHRRLYNLQRPLRIPNLYYPTRAITRPAECEALGASLRLKAIPVSFTPDRAPRKRNSRGWSSGAIFLLRHCDYGS